MAEHADTAELASATIDGEAESHDEASGRRFGIGPVVRTRFRGPVGAIVLCAIAIVALGAVGGVFGYQINRQRQAHAERDMFVEAARQGVINLTTIGYTTADADIARVLDSTTGGFHDDFQKRAQPFTAVVKQQQTRSEGIITSAAMQTQDDNQAEVMVTVSLKMGSVGAPDQPAHSWRMLIKVEKVGDTAKVSDVQFAT